MPTRSRAAAFATLLLVACVHGPDSRERKSAELQHALGMEALRGGRAGEALKFFEAAIEIDGQYPDPWLAKGVVLERALGKDKEAEAAYRKAIALNEGFPEAWNNLGQLLARTGRTEEALKAFDSAIAEMGYREPWVARLNKGLTLYQVGRRDEGIAEMRACLRAAPAYCAGHRQLGIVFMGEQRVKEAIDEFRTYVRYCDKIPDAHRQLGDAHKRAADADAARAEYQRCSELGVGTPDGEECLRSLEQLQ